MLLHDEGAWCLALLHKRMPGAAAAADGALLPCHLIAHVL